MTSGGLEVEVGAADTLPEDVTATATVTLPDGSRVEVDLQRTGLDSFAASVPGGEEGVYAVTVQVTRGDEVLYRDTTTAIRSYSAEYAPTPDDAGVLDAIVATGAGRLAPEPATAFDAAGLEAGTTTTPLWTWLALLALLLLPIDVGLRRLRLEREDLARWRRRRRGGDEGFGQTLHRPAPARRGGCASVSTPRRHPLPRLATADADAADGRPATATGSDAPAATTVGRHRSRRLLDARRRQRDETP